MTITSITRIKGEEIGFTDLLYFGKQCGDSHNQIQTIDFIEDKVGTAGFEPTASCTPSKLYPIFPPCTTVSDCFRY